MVIKYHGELEATAKILNTHKNSKPLSMVPPICTQLKYVVILTDIVSIRDDLQHTSDACEILVEGRKEGFKDPWMGVNETTVPWFSVSIVVWGKSEDQSDMDTTVGTVRPLFRVDPYAAESDYPKKAGSALNILYTCTARPQCHK